MMYTFKTLYTIYVYVNINIYASQYMKQMLNI